MDCSLSLVPLSDTQYDFNDCAPISGANVFEVELRAQLLDSYNVPVEGALVELIIFDSQGGPIREGGGCYDNTGAPLIDPDTNHFGLVPSDVPSFAIESEPGDAVFFSHQLWHASFGGKVGRRMFTLNFRQAQSDDGNSS